MRNRPPGRNFAGLPGAGGDLNPREAFAAAARRKAEQIAGLADVGLGDVISISESSGGGLTPQIFARTTLDSAVEFAPTPVTP